MSPRGAPVMPVVRGARERRVTLTGRWDDVAPPRDAGRRHLAAAVARGRPGQTRVRWKPAEERLAVGPRCPW